MIQRIFFPGDHWVYYKLYCNPSVSNVILLDGIYQLLNSWKSENIISRWFFIRYADPLPHIRVRFELTSLNNLGEILITFKQVLEPFIKKGFIHKYMIDTYTREIERYGINTINQCETFFYKDSLYVAKFIQNNNFSDIIYIIESVGWIFYLLTKIGSNGTDIKKLTTNMSSAYSKELNININQRVYIDSLFRKYKNNILKVYNQKNYTFDIYDDLKWLNQTSTPNTVVSSLIHMHINRLFPNNQRLYEYIIYYLFVKAFDTISHINKIGN